ncbi:hypothetical protein A2Z67_02280 [Candidatus Woesebacteria bacterium RBG_13_36_22]|uniref:Methyltransferase type 11 domain-containing protein n=1 Tax=Candidatus Woesebacteria bacterium RBG_13_36_22 TaxID=1802478 RepID=A0A1F7X1G4_9BACT|nr:MAG: hypothetical protein A2Z67_02280 [Candidatus Woesebacteria bacterium RBG_13_36_22]
MKTKVKKSNVGKIKVSRFPINQPKLNLACGKNKVEGFFGVDKVIVPGLVDEVVDLTLFPWPIKSESTDEIICSHYVEHIPHDSFTSSFENILRKKVNYADFRKEMIKFFNIVPSEGFVAFMEELHRIMKKGSLAKIICPYWSSIRCWQDPTHRRGMNEASFLYFNKAWRDVNVGQYPITTDFDYSYGYDISPDLLTKAQEVKDFAIKNYTNAVMDIQYLLTKR